MTVIIAIFEDLSLYRTDKKGVFGTLHFHFFSLPANFLFIQNMHSMHKNRVSYHYALHIDPIFMAGPGTFYHNTDMGRSHHKRTVDKFLLQLFISPNGGPTGFSSWIRIRTGNLFVHIRILPSASKQI
jgi:hypothetical protein